MKAIENALQKRIAAIVEEEAVKAAASVRARVIDEAVNLSVQLQERAANDYTFKHEVNLIIVDKGSIQ